MSFAELVLLELFLGAGPCSGHIAPSQQPIPAACKAEAHTGAHKSITATKHTHAPNLLAGALELWRILFIIPNINNTPPSLVRKFNSQELLFDRDSEELHRDIRRLPADGKHVMELLEILSAKAAILSWYDDNEWILAMKQQAA
jgi:hypothetical protein